MYRCMIMYLIMNERTGSRILINFVSFFSFCPRDSKLICILTVVILKIKCFSIIIDLNSLTNTKQNIENSTGLEGYMVYIYVCVCVCVRARAVYVLFRGGGGEGAEYSLVAVCLAGAMDHWIDPTWWTH